MKRKKRLAAGLIALILCAGLAAPLQAAAAQPPWPGVWPGTVLPTPAPSGEEAPEEKAPEEEAAGEKAPEEEAAGEEAPEEEAAGEEDSLPPEKPQLIAHACGAVYGYRLTNSLEALEAAYACGYRVMEADLSLTEDGEIVLIHDWKEMAERLLGSEGRRTLEEFCGAETFQDLTLLTLDDLLLWLEAHPDCRIVTDVKEEDNVAVLRQLKEQAGELAGAFIPQIYLPGDHDAVTALGYEDIILTFYRMGTVDALFLQVFLRSHALWAVTLPFEQLDEQLLQGLSARGIAVYAHTVNTLSDFESWQSFGLHGIYTDYFQPDHWDGGQG